MLNLWLALVADLVAVSVLVYGIYFRRHFRRDLVLAYVALNAGVLAATALLAGAGAGLGLGLGLFGILSIIRLRSDAITQEEVAYYFVALTLGLVNGLHPGAAWTSPTISLTLVVVMYVADHPRFASTTHRQTVTLDVAHPREDELRVALERLLDARVLQLVVLQLDLVRDTTLVDVRYRTDRGGARTSTGPTVAVNGSRPAVPDVRAASAGTTERTW